LARGFTHLGELPLAWFERSARVKSVERCPQV
jgi:hypothetical protein